MTNDEARFILRAFRADGSDAADPVFADALARADRDPALRAWFEHERAIDRAVSAQLEKAATASRSPAEILARVRQRRQRQRTWQTAAWLAAAAFAVLLAVSATLRFTGARPDVRQLITFALIDAGPPRGDHRGTPDAIGSAPAFPGSSGLRVGVQALPDLAALKTMDCRTLVVAGHEVIEFCFGPNHQFHVYIAPRGSFDTDGIGPTPLISEQDRLAAATWTDDRHVYTVVTDQGADVLRALL